MHQKPLELLFYQMTDQEVYHKKELLQHRNNSENPLSMTSAFSGSKNTGRGLLNKVQQSESTYSNLFYTPINACNVTVTKLPIWMDMDDYYQ